MPAYSFAITWDYRCPFARNAHEHVLAALDDGADWNVQFVPFSLGQVHVAEGDPDIWETPEKDSGLLALQAGTVVRDQFPEKFPAVHWDLFAARHDHGLAIKDEAVVRDVLARHDVDADAVLAEIAGGGPLKSVQTEHEQVAASHKVWGVPTFLVDGQAVFVRLMDRPDGDATRARRSIEGVVKLLAWPELNEFKHTSIAR